MIARIIAWSIRNRFLVLLAAVVLAIGGVWAALHTPLDAIPDISDNQVLVYTTWPGRSPQLVEDQVTYPLETSLDGMPGVKTVRGQSEFGFSLITVIFRDGVDLYWARSRVLERLNQIQGSLPRSVVPTLGPDGTGVGQIFWYTVAGKGYDLGTLRAIQDWYIRYALQSVPGVAEVASGGGYQREYQVDVDPLRLRMYGVTVGEVANAIKESNAESGGGLMETAGSEYMIRGQGYITGVKDLEDTVVKAVGGVPVLIRDVATVQLGGAERRGVLDENGRGEAVVGVIVMRSGANAKGVIDAVKAKIKAISPGLPPGVHIRAVYDRSQLIMRSVATLIHTLVEESLIVSAVVLLFLGSVPGALTVVLSIPLAVLASFILMKVLGVTSNIMSLGGVAIAVGVLIDAAVVMVENAYRHLAEPEFDPDDRSAVIARAAQQVGRPIVFSLVIILVAFVPVFFLTGAEGRMFRPLAFTKTFAMGAGAILAVTLVPVLMTLLMRGKMQPEEKSPLSRFFIALYRPVIDFVLEHRVLTLTTAIVVGLLAIPIARGLGSEFMPPLNEGTLLYMPATLPHVNLTEAKRLMQIEDRIIKSFPEVKDVLGKVGRIDSATDPAPPSMAETIVSLQPRSQWPVGMTQAKLIDAMNAKLDIPGVTGFWTMPIINRINMLATGVQTDLGLKIFGSNLQTLQGTAMQAADLIKKVPGVTNAYAARSTDGRYLDITPDRLALARYGLDIGQVQAVIDTELGGKTLTTMVEGRDRFPVRLRFARDFRSSPEAIGAIEIPTPSGADIPLAALARIRIAQGPPMIQSENGMLTGLVYVQVSGRDIGSVVHDADALLKARLHLPPGYYSVWSGQYQNLVHAKARLSVLIPITLGLLWLLLYFTFNNGVDATLLILSVPFALVGGVALQALMKVHFSVAVAIGYIALAGVAVETGVVMLVYLHEALERKRQLGPLTLQALREATIEGAVLRLRPKLMTVFAALAGLVPILWSTGTGSDVMRPIAIPMIGGLLTSSILVLLVIPVLFLSVQEWTLRKTRKAEEPCPEETRPSLA